MKKSKRKILSLFLVTSIFISIFPLSLYANNILTVENNDIIESGYTVDGLYYEISVKSIDTKAYHITSKDVTMVINVSPLSSPSYNFSNTYYYSDGNFTGTH